MSTFSDHDDENDFLPDLPSPLPSSRLQTANAHASSSSSRPTERESSIAYASGSGSRSFLSRLESTVSPNGKDERNFVLEEASRFGDEADGGLDPDGDEDELGDVKRMGEVWVKERGTVEIMGWEGDLVDSLFDKLEQQVRRLRPVSRLDNPSSFLPPFHIVTSGVGELTVTLTLPSCPPPHLSHVQQKMLQTLRSDPQTSEEEHFKLVLVQTEMERVKFLVRSYVRTRLAKVRLPVLAPR